MLSDSESYFGLTWSVYQISDHILGNMRATFLSKQSYSRLAPFVIIFCLKKNILSGEVGENYSFGATVVVLYKL